MPDTATRPDWLIEESEEAYHARRGQYLTSHSLADFRKCPLLFRQKQLGLVKDQDTAAYSVGRVAHTLILEGGDAFAAKYVVGGPINPKTGNPYGKDTKTFAEWAAEQDGEVIAQETADQARLLADAVAQHKIARELLSGGIAEGVVDIDVGHPMPMQARIDYYRPDTHSIIDLKTCQDLTWFESDARRYGYGYQLAFYYDLVRMVSDQDPIVYMVAVEKQAPYRVGVWHVDQDTIFTFATENNALIQHLHQCIQWDVWPTGYEKIRVWSLVEYGREAQ